MHIAEECISDIEEYFSSFELEFIEKKLTPNLQELPSQQSLEAVQLPCSGVQAGGYRGSSRVSAFVPLKISWTTHGSSTSL